MKGKVEAGKQWLKGKAAPTSRTSDAELQNAAIADADRALRSSRTHEDAESRLERIRSRHGLPLHLVVESRDAVGEHVHVQTSRTQTRVIGETLIDHEQLRRIVRRVVQEQMRRKDIKSRYREMRRRLTAEAGLEIRGSGDFAAAAAAQRREGRTLRPGSYHTHQVGQEATEVDVRENKTQGRTNARVMDIGTYPEIASQIAATRLGDRRVAKELRSLIQKGVVSPDITPEQRRLLSNLSYLVVVRETSRNPRNLTHVAMLLDLVAQGTWTWHTAFAAFENVPGITGGRGNYPMSMEGAAGAARGLTAEDQGLRPSQVPERGGTEKERRELEAREFTIVEEWISEKLKTQQPLSEMQPDIVRERIRTLLLEFLGR